MKTRIKQLTIIALLFISSNVFSQETFKCETVDYYYKTNNSDSYIEIKKEVFEFTIFTFNKELGILKVSNGLQFYYHFINAEYYDNFNGLFEFRFSNSDNPTTITIDRSKNQILIKEVVDSTEVLKVHDVVTVETNK